MDYQDILNMLYIANARVWYNEENKDLYAYDAIRGSNDTWAYFFKIIDENHATAELPELLCELLNNWNTQEEGRNWYSYTAAYYDWNNEIIPLLESAGYPLYPDYLRMYPIQLENNVEYQKYREEEKQLLNVLSKNYKFD